MYIKKLFWRFSFTTSIQDWLFCRLLDLKLCLNKFYYHTSTIAQIKHKAFEKHFISHLQVQIDVFLVLVCTYRTKVTNYVVKGAHSKCKVVKRVHSSERFHICLYLSLGIGKRWRLNLLESFEFLLRFFIRDIIFITCYFVVWLQL